MNPIKVLFLALGGLFLGGLSTLGAQSSAAASPLLSALAVSPDGQIAAAAFRGDTAILLFDLQTGLPRQFLTGFQQPLSFLAFSEEDACLVGAGPGEVIRWRLPDFRFLDRTPVALESAAAASGPYAYDPARSLLYRSDPTAVYAISLRQGGLGKVLKVRQKEASGAAQLLAQAPDCEELWVLDPQSGELCRVELTRFRPQIRTTIPDACALAADNHRLAVLRRPPTDSISTAYQLELLDDGLQRQSVYSLELDLPAGTTPRLVFTGPSRLAIPLPDGIVEVDLSSGIATPRRWGYAYDDLFLLTGGAIWLQQNNALLQLDDWGGWYTRYALEPGPEPLAGERFHLDGRTLREEQGRALLSIPPPETPVGAAVAEEYLAVGLRTGAVAVYRIAEGRRLWTLSARAGLPGRLCLSASPGRLAIQRGASEVELYDLSDGKLIARWHTGGDPVTALTFFRQRLILGRRSGRLTLIQADDGRFLAETRVQNQAVTALTFAEKAGYLLLGGRGGVIACDTSCLEPQLRFRGHTGAVRRMEVADDGRHFRSIGDDGIGQIWELPIERLVADGRISAAAVDRPVWTVRGGLLSEARPEQMAFSRQGALLASWDDYQFHLNILEAGSDRPRLTIPVSFGGPPTSLHFFDDQDVLLLARGTTIEYWDPWTRQLLKRLDYPMLPRPFGEVVKQAGREVLWTFLRGSDQVVRLDAGAGDRTGGFRVRPAGREGSEVIRSLTLSGDGRRLAVGTANGLYLYDTENADPLAFLPVSGQTSGDGRAGVWFSPDGSWIACRQGREVAVFDLYQEKEVFRAPGIGVVFLDHRYLAVYHGVQEHPALFDIWDYLRGEPAGAVEPCHGEVVTDAAFHRSSGRLATRTGNGIISWWRLGNREAKSGKWLLPEDHLPPPTPGKATVPVRMGKD